MSLWSEAPSATVIALSTVAYLENALFPSDKLSPWHTLWNGAGQNTARYHALGDSWTSPSPYPRALSEYSRAYSGRSGSRWRLNDAALPDEYTRDSEAIWPERGTFGFPVTSRDTKFVRSPTRPRGPRVNISVQGTGTG
jgi:hypothetical protein